MKTTAPHYLLFTEAKHVSGPTAGGRWRFVLEQIGTAFRIDEADIETNVRGERLQLLAVVRGLEALEQRSRVTLITPSKYVGRGIRNSLSQWRKNDWKWERFGILTLVKNHDLWQRIDQAMRIHEINCRIWQFDPPLVRTQVAHESDESEPGEIGLASPVSNADIVHLSGTNGQDNVQVGTAASEATGTPEVEASFGRGNHLKLNFDRGREAMEYTMEHVNRVSGLLSDRIKPMGQGRAYGHAAS